MIFGTRRRRRRRELYDAGFTDDWRQLCRDRLDWWDVLAPDVANAAQAGHFVMLRLHEGSERIPLTVADFDRERGTVTMGDLVAHIIVHELAHHFGWSDADIARIDRWWE